MIWTALETHWAEFEVSLGLLFPHAEFANSPPDEGQRDAFVQAIAQGHDLTLPEVTEILEDVVLHGWVTPAANEARAA